MLGQQKMVSVELATFRGGGLPTGMGEPPPITVVSVETKRYSSAARGLHLCCWGVLGVNVAIQIHCSDYLIVEWSLGEALDSVC